MKKSKNFQNLPKALILCGGLGERLKKVLGSNPKFLAPIGGKTFLDFQLDWLMKKVSKMLFY